MMIRKMEKTDVNAAAKIWLDTNIKAHHFIPAQYWREHFDEVKELLAQSEIYIYENENEIDGFVGLMDNYIAGIFVRSEVQSCGIGKQLLDFVKGKKKQLKLSVYEKNTKAISFYERERFVFQSENIDENTGETEYIMTWSK